MKFDKGLLEDLKRQVSIVDVMSPSVSWDRKSNRAKGDLWAPCVLHGGNSATLHVREREGYWLCFSCGEKGDAISWMMKCEGMSFQSAAETLAGMAGMNISRETETEEEEARREKRSRDAQRRKASEAKRAEDDEARRIETAGGMWRSSQPLRGTLADAYMRSRCMELGAEPNLRFHPALSYPNAGKHPAMVARVQDASGAGRAVWRIFLRPDGSGKADVPGKPKLGFGPASGGAVRLGGEDAKEIGIAEGVETSVAAGILDTRLPVWAGLSTSGIIGFIPPPHVTFVRIFPDGDLARIRDEKIYQPSGIEAARKLHERLQAEGRVRSEIVDPPFNADYADLLMDICQ